MSQWASSGKSELNLLKLIGLTYHDQTILCSRGVTSGILCHTGSVWRSRARVWLCSVQFCQALWSPQICQTLLSQPVCMSSLWKAQICPWFWGILRAYISDQPDPKWKERFVGFGLLKLHRLQRGFCPQVLIVKWGVITCTVSGIQWIPSVTIFVSKSSFLRWVNDDLSSTALSPEDTKLEQMGNALVFHNMFREKAAPRN